MRYLKLRNGLLTSRTRTGDLDKVAGVDANKVGRVLGLVDLSVRTGARELNLRPGTALEVVEVLTTTPDKSAVLGDGNVDAENDTVLQVRSDLLELRLELRDELGLATEADFVSELTLAGAAHDTA